MNRKNWRLGYRATRAWMNNRMSESEYLNYLQLYGIGERDRLMLIRIYSLRSTLYGKDSTQAARDRIFRKIFDWRLAHSY